ncbi:MAG: thiamine pyrophosphate-binding protein [Alphaproteobacteria bacterium]|nr:thiamine pyrophosphate-binding protein [Alphaproteobacteria bacterium]
MKVSDYIAAFIKEQKIDTVFGYIGGMVAHLVDSISKTDGLEMVNGITEQGAGFAADGYARQTGKVAIAISSSGPGALNLLTPLADCFFDSIPAVFITGQVNTYEYKKYPQLRQSGFQETDIVSVAEPITKYCQRITKPENIRYELEKAFYIAQSGRKGPVLLDIPMDMQRQDVDVLKLEGFCKEEKTETADDAIDEMIRLLKKSSKPVILVGNGVRQSHSEEKLRAFLDKTGIPCVASLLGKDAIDNDYPYYLGGIGTYGNRNANLSLMNSDVLLVLGARLDILQTGSHPENFAPDAHIIQVDNDQKELDSLKVKKIKVFSDIGRVVDVLNGTSFDFQIDDWKKTCLELKDKYPSEISVTGKQLLPNMLIKKISKHCPEKWTVTADVGQNQMWVFQSAKVKKQNRFLFSGGLGSMGFSLPAAIGVAAAGGKVLSVSGDGGFQMNLQELEVIARRKLPVKMIIFNNHSLGMIRNFQSLYFNGKYPSSQEDYSAPDFSKVANAYGIKAQTKAANDIDDDVLRGFFETEEAELLEIALPVGTTVEPQVIFGNNLDRMSP